MPPRALTLAWEAPAWLQCAQMAAITAKRPSEVEELDAYLARGGPSQFKLLRLESEAMLGWRCQGYIISEELDEQRARAATLQSLDLSALLFPPFSGYARAPRGLPLEHVRLSTRSDAKAPPVP